MKRNVIFLLIYVLTFPNAAVSDSALDQQRTDFLLVEKMIEKNQQGIQFFNTMDKLKGYPLYPYLQYHWLRKNLNQTIKIKKFLADYNNTRYAYLLNNTWLNYLAKNKDWSEYLDYYKSSNSTKLQCYFYFAKYKSGFTEEAMLAAQNLWNVGKSQPNECDPLFKALQNSSYFTNAIRWQRFEAALINNKVKLAKYIKTILNRNDQSTAKIWINIHNKPGLIGKANLLNRNNPKSGSIFAHAIYRMARSNLSKAIQLWDIHHKDYQIDAETKHRVEQKLAMTLAYRRDDMAYDRLSKLKTSDEATQEWRVRTALRQQNWQHVEQSISALNEQTKEKEKWQYWLARALEKTNKLDMANFIYSKLSSERSYFGYLSADKLNKNYELADYPIQITDKDLQMFKQKVDYQLVYELIMVNKLKESKRQWWYLVKKLDKNELLIASKVAQLLGWKQEAIFTIAKAKYWDDVSLRFPLDFKPDVQKNATLQQLNPAVVFALIRRESAFNEYARSPVGARGLMQIMPATGKQIARELKQKWRGVNHLFNPSTNVKFGSYYYKKLLNRFGGHYALAAAGYNAGPHRVKRWLPTDRNVPADIWVETIPFNETRAYVSAVLTYALIYQSQLGEKLLTMKDFMRDVLTGYVNE